MSSFIALVVFSLLATSHGQADDEPMKCDGGVCVPKLFCPNGTYNSDPKQAQIAKIIGLRINLDFDDRDDCIDYLMICCDTSSPPATEGSPNEDHNADGEIIVPPPSGPLNFPCGQTNENGLFYNLHSNETLAQYAEFPWMVYISASDETSADTTFVCGGTLIHPMFVVTTAHNVDGKSNLIARFGEWDISTDKEPLPHVDINVEEIITHNQYVLNPIQNDIALLLLERRVDYQNHIRPICLPAPGDLFDDKRCISNGWGSVRGVYANILKKLTLPAIPRAKCQRMLRFGGLGPFYQLSEGFMCAGGEINVDTCKGDGGSPLACPNDDGSFVLAGIVSWGIGCGGHNVPGVYVSINKYVAWINDQIFKTDSLLNLAVK